MRSLALIFVLSVGCSSSSFDLSNAADAGAGSDTSTEADSRPRDDTGIADTVAEDADTGGCTDPPLTPPPCIAANGTYASQFDYSGALISPVKLDATRQHRFSFRMGVDGRVEKIIFRIKPPSAEIVEEYLSLELIASMCSAETVLADQTLNVMSSGDYVFKFDGTNGKLAPIVRAGTPLQVRIRTNSFVGYEVYVVKEPIPNPNELSYSYRALPDGTTFTPIADVVPAAGVWTRGCGI